MTKPTIPPSDIANWRLRVRFKLYRESGVTGKMTFGLYKAYTYGISGSATGNPVINVADYTQNQWNDVLLYAQLTNISGAQLVGGFDISPGSPIVGGRVFIGGLYIDEVGATPGVPQKNLSGSYTLQITDNGLHLYNTTGGWTVPNNSDVALPTEFIVTLVNNSGSSQTVSKGGSVTLMKSGSGSQSSLTVAAYGMCTLLKTNTDTWYASGNI
jgi:hypothetical protein